MVSACSKSASSPESQEGVDAGDVLARVAVRRDPQRRGPAHRVRAAVPLVEQHLHQVGGEGGEGEHRRRVREPHATGVEHRLEQEPAQQRVLGLVPPGRDDARERLGEAVVHVLPGPRPHAGDRPRRRLGAAGLPDPRLQRRGQGAPQLAQHLAARGVLLGGLPRPVQVRQPARTSPRGRGPPRPACSAVRTTRPGPGRSSDHPAGSRSTPAGTGSAGRTARSRRSQWFWLSGSTTIGRTTSSTSSPYRLQRSSTSAS